MSIGSIGTAPTYAPQVAQQSHAPPQAAPTDSDGDHDNSPPAGMANTAGAGRAVNLTA